MRRSLRWRTKPPAGVRADPATSLGWGAYGLWGLEDGSGPTCWDVVGANPLNLVGSVGWTVTSDGPALAFPGAAGNYLQSQGPIFDPAGGDFSAAIWVLTTTTAFQAFLATSGGSGTTWLEAGVGNHLWCTLGSGTALKASAVVTPGVWHHVALTLQGTTVTIYLDGTPAASAVVPLIHNVGGKLNVGIAADGATNPLNGQVGRAGVLLATRCWAPEEVAWLAEAWYATRLGPAALRAAARAGVGGVIGSGAVTLGPLGALGSAAGVVPVWSAGGALTLGPLAVAGAALGTAPVWSGSGVPTLGPLVAAGAGTVATVTFAGAGTPTLGALEGVGVATRAVPQILATGGPTLAPLTASGLSGATGTLFVGSGAPTLGTWSVVGAAFAALPVILGNGTPALGSLTVAGLGAVVAPSRYVPSQIYGNITPLSTGGPAVVKARIRPA